MGEQKLGRYGKIYALGHRYTRDLVGRVVRVEEKVDGSQFSFGVREGQLLMRSKRVTLYPEGAPKQFAKAIETVVKLFEAGLLMEGWTYRGEAFSGPRHNALTYGRMPIGGIVLYDVDRELQDYMSYDELAEEAKRLQLEVVPLLYYGPCERKALEALLETQTMLVDEEGNGPKVEGIVVKPSDDAPVFGIDGLPIRAKIVSEAFKERLDKLKFGKPKKGDVILEIAESVAPEARWLKAIQRLRDEGRLDESPKDIGPLMKAIQDDVVEEEEDWIKDRLWKEYKGHICRATIRGFADWYKQRLMDALWDEAEANG